MKVQVRILFDSPTEEDWRDMRSLAGGLTDDRDSVCVTADLESPGWLMAEFTMPTEAQYNRPARLSAGFGLRVCPRPGDRAGRRSAGAHRLRAGDARPVAVGCAAAKSC